MFERNHLADLSYSIALHNIYLYEDRLQININVYTFSDDEGKSRHPLFTSRKEYPRSGNLLYWDEHYAPITDFDRVLFDQTKYEHRKNICRRCFGRFYTKESLAKHERLCTREDFMLVLHVFPAPNTEQAHIKLMQFRNTYEAPFVVYSNFKSILEPIQRQNKNTLYDQHHKISAAYAIFV